jgi:hypothetical protein
VSKPATAFTKAGLRTSPSGCVRYIGELADETAAAQARDRRELPASPARADPRDC